MYVCMRRAAVQQCPEEAEDVEAGGAAVSAEERQRQLEARHENIRLITGQSTLLVLYYRRATVFHFQI